MVKVSARLREDFSDYFRTCLSSRGVQNTAIEINVKLSNPPTPVLFDIEC